MSIKANIIEEIKLLNQFSIDSMAVGIKVHETEASKMVVDAAERLYSKGLTDHVDGGYLTKKGIEAAEHVKSLINLLEA